MIVSMMMMVMAATQQAAPPAVQPSEKKVCRSRPVTGYRAKFDRVCRTRAEWRAIDDEQRRVGGQLIDQQRLRNLGN